MKRARTADPGSTPHPPRFFENKLPSLAPKVAIRRPALGATVAAGDGLMSRRDGDRAAATIYGPVHHRGGGGGDGAAALDPHQPRTLSTLMVSCSCRVINVLLKLL